MEKNGVTKPLLAGIIYGEVVYWILILSMAIAIPGFIIYLRSGGYLDSQAVLDHLWRGCDCLTIWKEVGNISRPIPWYSCIGMLSQGDMLAMLGIVVTGIAAVIGMWGAFLGTLRSKNGIYIIFALIIAIVLTLSAMGLLKIQM